MEKELEVFPASLHSLEAIRTFVLKICNSITLSQKRAYGLCLAIDEIATNIIEYGYPLAGIEQGVIKIIMKYNNKQLCVTLVDGAVAFNPLDYLVPRIISLDNPLDERAIGGLGILLAKQNVDEFNYKRDNEYNHNQFVINVST